MHRFSFAPGASLRWRRGRSVKVCAKAYRHRSPCLAAKLHARYPPVQEQSLPFCCVQDILQKHSQKHRQSSMPAYKMALACYNTLQRGALTQTVACHIYRALYDTAYKIGEKLCPGVNGQPQLLFCKETTINLQLSRSSSLMKAKLSLLAEVHAIHALCCHRIVTCLHELHCYRESGHHTPARASAEGQDRPCPRRSSAQT